MGAAESFGLAFAKAQLAANQRIPVSGRVFISVNDSDKPHAVPIARHLADLGFELVATRGTAQALAAAGIAAGTVFKVNEGRPNVVDLIKSAKLGLIINTPLGRASFFDEKAIRRAAVQRGVCSITTLSAAAAAVNGIRARKERGVEVASLQELHQKEAVGHQPSALGNPSG